MSFADQIRAYRARMGLSQRALAKLIGKSAGSVGNWESETAAPTLEDLPGVAKALGVSTDWLLGIPVSSMWGLEIQDLRLWLRGQVATVVARNAVDRMLRVIDLAESHSPLCREKWFVAGILRLSEKDYEQFRSRSLLDIDVILPELAEFTSLPDAWFMHGDNTLLATSPVDPGDYANALIELARRRISGEVLFQLMDQIEQMADFRRQLLERR